MSQIDELVSKTFERESRVVIAALLSTVRDIELAEDALQDALIDALGQWSEKGIPQNTGAWIMSVSRRKLIDKLRRQSTQTKYLPALHALNELERQAEQDISSSEIPDERLKLMFTCCHPALAHDVQVALTLQIVAGIPTDTIAKTFIVPPSTMAQRLVRAKRKIRDANIPYDVPDAHHLGERLNAVLSVIYFIFNAGYTAPYGEQLLAIDLCEEAIRLARTLHHLLTKRTDIGEHAETKGLLALMLLHHARRDARIDQNGHILLLEEQDRQHWDQDAIGEGIDLLDQALTLHQPGPYQIQAAIVALHVESDPVSGSDWHQITLLYQSLMLYMPSSVVELNRAVAVSKVAGAEAGLLLLDNKTVHERLESYYLYHATRADFLRQLGRIEQAIIAYNQALQLCDNQVERAFLEKQITMVSTTKQ